MDESYQAMIHPQLGDSLPRADDYAEARYLCAYNQTRGCILGVEIACGDFSLASLLQRLPMLTPRSGAGLWLDPFRGIPADDVIVPLDLIYLDDNYRILAVVELFPAVRVPPNTPPAASLLALPSGSVHSSHTQTGDQVTFSRSEDMEQELARLRPAVALPSPVQEVLAPPEKPETIAAAVSQPEENAAAKEAASDKIVEAKPVDNAVEVKPVDKAVEAKPWVKKPSKPKSWLERLLFGDDTPNDARKAERLALTGLAAYFWDGGAPKAHDILNISDTGLYVVTDERWYPGTLVQMTLKKTTSDGKKIESSISLMACANRWGNDGVGLGFVVHDPRKPRHGENDGVDRAELDRFLARIKQ
jgi:hypothetical protein